MTLPRWVPIAVLFAAAVASSLILWKIYRAEQLPPLVGPPRSDYFLQDFELVALDSAGQEAFRVTGPRLARHPYLGTITIDQPRFVFPDGEAEPWTARADQGWASANGSELRLHGDVALNGPADDAQGPLAFHTESMNIFPAERRASSDDLVEFTSLHSILQGRGFRADMQTRRFQLLSEVIGRYDTPTSPSRH